MKTFFLIGTCLLLVSIAAHSQVAYQNKINPTGYKALELKLKSKSLKNENTQHYFTIIDKRPDTTRLGFMKNDAYEQLYFHFKEPASQYISDKVNYKKSFTDSIIIVLNRLWVFDNKVACISHVVADIFKKIGDDYFLIQQYDSAMKTSGYIGNKADYLLEKNLRELIISADNVGKNIPHNLSKSDKPGSRADTLPPVFLVLKPTDGIYENFQDFLNNTPKEISFKYEVRVKKREEILVLDNVISDDSVYTKNNWGFCKDGFIYMRIGESYSKLTKIENSFELRGIDLARYYYTKNNFNVSLLFLDNGINNFQFSPGGSLLLTGLSFIPKDRRTSQFENISPYKLDLTTGELY